MSPYKRIFVLRERRHVEFMLQELAANWERHALDGKPLTCTLTETKRSLEQNALLWTYLTAWSRQKLWPVNGQMVELTPEEWKDVLSAAFTRETARIAQGLDGGMVLLGARTSQFTVRQMRDFLDFIQAAAAQHGVDLDDRSGQVRAESMERAS